MCLASEPEIQSPSNCEMIDSRPMPGASWAFATNVRQRLRGVSKPVVACPEVNALEISSFFTASVRVCFHLAVTSMVFQFRNVKRRNPARDSVNTFREYFGGPALETATAGTLEGVGMSYGVTQPAWN